jgi:hypothetical protein
MCDCHRRYFVQLGLMAVGSVSVAGVAMAADAPPSSAKKVYTCPPCGCPNDGKEFPEPGACSACGMPMVEKVAAAAPQPVARKAYTCPPCGCPNDGKEFAEAGACSACGMPLMEIAAAPPKPDKPSLAAPKG